MPPPPGIAGLSFFGSSATIASVVIKRPVLAYNLTRVMNIMGIQPLMAAMRA
jgi:hypothetical protein